jgi:hypothetical protein
MNEWKVSSPLSSPSPPQSKHCHSRRKVLN